MTAWRVAVSAILGAVAGWLAWFLYVSWTFVTSGELAAVSVGAVVGLVLALGLTVRNTT